MARKAMRRPKAPKEFAYILRWYDDIRAGQEAAMGHNRLSHQEIIAYRDLYGFDMDPFDLDTLRRLDDVWLSCQPKDGG